MARVTGMRGLFAGAVIAAAACFAAPMSAFAHGGVALEQDECVLRIGPNSMHFIGYQRSGEEAEFCEDIANTGPTVIALTPVSPDLRDMAVGIRIVKDVGEEKEKANLDAITVAYIAPKVYRNGAMTFEHDFKQAGHYVGIVTVRDDLGNEWVSRFPFSVGLYTFWGMFEYILYGVGFFSLVGLLWWALRAGAKKKAQTGDAIA
ncbi:hypothetical protein [Methylocystis sp.]|uniref:hypothetical protein n=1 Tax=Methylocystis sp. TaxID=1911079 RepID=UPI003D0EB6A7